MARTKYVGMDVCPYCKGTDLEVKETRFESDPPDAGPGPEDYACIDYGCENCGRHWTVECRPVAYFLYDQDDEFDDTPRNFVVVEE